MTATTASPPKTTRRLGDRVFSGSALLAGLGAGTNFAPLLITAGLVGVVGAVLTMFIRGVR